MGSLSMVDWASRRTPPSRCHAPFVKPPYEPEGMMGLAFEYDYWLQTLCNSRRRGIGYIAGYSTVA